MTFVNDHLYSFVLISELKNSVEPFIPKISIVGIKVSIGKYSLISWTKIG